MPIQSLPYSKPDSLLLLFIMGVVIFLLSVLWIRNAEAADDPPPLQTVQKVDIDRYTGTWYEIARFPEHFEKGCVASTTTYSLRGDGKINVLNQCRNETLDGELRTAKGTAWVVDRQTNAKLKVRFLWPFSGDYWIIDLGPNYDYAVVGHPKRIHLWILSRQRQMDPATYQEILKRLEAQHYNISRLNKTLQP